MRLQEIICESLADWDTGRWVHYSDHEMMSIKLKSFHQDPLGIYFFPEKFQHTVAIWQAMTYRYTVTLKPGARVLDYGSISDDELARIVEACGATALLDEYTTRHPPEGDRPKLLRMAWEMMRNSMILNGGGGRARWTNILRRLGWDAIFDDSGAIHSREVQLLVINPAILVPVLKETLKPKAFEAMTKVVADLEALGKEFGEVEVEEPRRRRDGWSSSSPMKLMANVRVTNGDRYATIVVRHDKEHVRAKNQIDASLQYTRPMLNAGYGLTYSIPNERYDSYSNLDQIRIALEKVFQPEAKAA